MSRRFSPEQLAALLFALARTALCGYRAATQSFTVDESTSYLEYVRGPWARVFQHYDPNNHVLYSLLAKLSIHAFRVSEFTLRLPSVMAGFFLILGIYWVLEFAVSSRAVRWAALATLSLNPLLLDLSVAARGYGLGLAFLVWAIYFSMRGRDLLAGALLGLGVAANLTIAFPALGVIACPLSGRGKSGAAHAPHPDPGDPSRGDRGPDLLPGASHGARLSVLRRRTLGRRSPIRADLYLHSRQREPARPIWNGISELTSSSTCFCPF